MGMPGISELIVIFSVILLLFGGKKLPELGEALGESIRNFRRGIKSADDPAPAALPKADEVRAATASAPENKA